MKLNLFTESIEDQNTRDALTRIQEYLNATAILRGEWKFIDIEFTGATTNYKYPHGFRFVPVDVIETHKSGAGVITFNFDDFDRTNIDITTTGACRVRALVGLYRERE